MEGIIRDPSRAVRLLIFEAAKRNDPILSQLAMEALTAIGKDVVPVLMNEVLNSDNVQYRLRLLNVIEEIGEMPDPADHLDLFRLTSDRDARVRTAAARAIHAVGPRGPRRCGAAPAAATST
jgi:hypothetical protein